MRKIIYKNTSNGIQDDKNITTLEIVFNIVSMPFSYWEYTFLQREFDYVQHLIF